MESKWSLSPPKPEKRTRKKKTSRQSSQQCLTEPTQPHKDTLRSTEQTLSNSEGPSVGGTQQDEIPTKEASAVDYLRDLSEDESNQFVMNSNIAPLEEEEDPVDTSDRLSPFNDPKKKKKQSVEKPIEKPVKEKKPVLIPTTSINVQHIQSKVAQDIYRPREEIPGDVRKRVRSEPNEGVRTLKAMQGKSYQFQYPKFLTKGLANKMNFATTFHREEENDNQYDLKVEERMTQRDFRSAENHGLHHIHNRVNTKEDDSGYKLPSVLQIKKLVGCSYSQLLQNMIDPQGAVSERQITTMTTQENENYLITNRLPIRKAFSPGEKKLSDTKQSNQQQQAGDNVVLVGRSLSVPKIPQGFEKMAEKSESNFRAKKGAEQGYDVIVDRRYKEENPFRRLSPPDSKVTNQYNTLTESMERIYSENKKSEINNTPRGEEGNNVKYHKSKAKSELPMHLVSDKKGGFGDFRDQKIIEDMKATFLFKSKKGMIDIVSPEEEVHISREDHLEKLIQQRNASRNPSRVPSRVPSRGASRGGIRESGMENKLSNGKSLNGPLKLKLHHLVNKKPKEPLSTFLLPEIQETLKAKLKAKEALTNIRDNKLSNPLSRKNSNRDIKVDGPVFSIKIPKFKAILKAVGKNIESERLSPLLRPTEREMMSERPTQVQMLTKKAL